MTGEMSWINQDGEDSNGETWAIHAAVAKAVGGELKPFGHRTASDVLWRAASDVLVVMGGTGWSVIWCYPLGPARTGDTSTPSLRRAPSRYPLHGHMD